MRINVYSQELTEEVLAVEKKSNTGYVYSAVQFVLHSSDKLHHPPHDDDRSAVTFWLPRSLERRKAFADALRRAAEMVEGAPPETGLDETPDDRVFEELGGWYFRSPLDDVPVGPFGREEVARRALRSWYEIRDNADSKDLKP